MSGLSFCTMRINLVPALLCLALLSTGAVQAAAHPQAEVVNTPASAGPASHMRARTYAIAGARLIKPDTLRISYHAGYVPCYGKLGEVEVRQNTKTVTITLHRVYPQPYKPDQACPQFLAIKWTTVKLNAPLGGRSLIDGANGRAVSLHH